MSQGSTPHSFASPQTEARYRPAGDFARRLVTVTVTVAVAVAVAAAVVLVSAPAWARTPACDSLPQDKKGEAKKLLSQIFSYDCCDRTVAECLAVKPNRCRLAVRLANDICRLLKAGVPAKDTELVLSQRAQSMIPTGARFAFELEDSMAVGPANAPVQVVVYACTRCPFCKQLLPLLFREVATGSLQGKVRLYFRPFPLRDHPGSTEGGLALLAAAEQNKLWPFLLYLYERFDQFAPEKLPEWAASLGMDKESFAKTSSAAPSREKLVATKREGLRNKVAATPSLFINGRKYVYDLDLAVLVDVLLEEHERVTGNNKEGQ
ncbi:MAG: DsbA family protein [Pseudomonadota bacterium]